MTSRASNITLARHDAQADRSRVDQVAAIVVKDPSVDRVFERVNVGSGRVSIVLKKDREVTSTEFERNLSPTLAASRTRG
jgi:hypothetical protein